MTRTYATIEQENIELVKINETLLEACREAQSYILSLKSFRIICSNSNYRENWLV
jgi:hypothetical protein